MLQFTTKNGKTYQLKMKDGDHFLRWYGDGEMHPILKGAYTGIKEAESAMNKYLREVDSGKAIKKAATPSEILNPLEKKNDLIEFADRHLIKIPEEMKIPSQIKKYLRTQVGG